LYQTLHLPQADWLKRFISTS